MKNVKLVGLVLLLNLAAGCHLLPGNAEYFQKKVKAVPTPALQPALVESQKQAADFVDKKIDEAKTAAAATAADVSVQVPLAEAATVSGPLSTSLGPPARPWTDSAPKLAVKVDAETAKLDKKVATYAQKTAPLVGKEIEGTGLFQIGFFTQWALVLGVLALGWVAFRIYGLTNPVAGLAGKAIGRVSSTLLNTALHQTVSAGERFKAAIEKRTDPMTPAEIKALLREYQERSQDAPVQDLIKSITAHAKPA